MPLARSLAFFNNKGGVGKTTLACNMAACLVKLGIRQILLVDCDPQCNATQLVLSENQWEEIYGNRRESVRRTVLRVFRHIRVGDSSVDTDLDIVQSARFGIDILPGHPSLSMVEDRLSSSWIDFRGGDPGGARRSMWASFLVEAAVEAGYELVVFDVGPSLGALNRCVLLGSERFVTPMAADLFSLYALDNIGEWIRSWTRDYSRGYDSLYERAEIELEKFHISRTPKTEHAFAGYTVQQYVTKRMGGLYRTVNAYDRYRKQIPDRANALASLRAPGVTNIELGLVPNMFSMIPLAQSVHSPIFGLTSADGLRGAQVSQQARYAEKLEEIARALLRNLEVSVQ
ncbi:MAG: ParA family protein [Acidithiobacillus sp.]|nr:ParA family protein [Acidithiobacillus sp.]